MDDADETFVPRKKKKKKRPKARGTMFGDGDKKKHQKRKHQKKNTLILDLPDNEQDEENLPDEIFDKKPTMESQLPRRSSLKSNLSIVLTPVAGNDELINGFDQITPSKVKKRSSEVLTDIDPSLFASINDAGMSQEIVLSQSPPGRRTSITLGKRRSLLSSAGSSFGSKFMKKSDEELLNDLKEPICVTRVKLGGNKKRYVLVANSRLWWVKNTSLATELMNGSMDNQTEKSMSSHSYELSSIVEVYAGVTEEGVFHLDTNHEYDTNLCCTIVSMSDNKTKKLDLAMETSKEDRDRWVLSLGQLAKRHRERENNEN